MNNRDSPIVYVCSPYSGDVEKNTEMAKRYCRYAIGQGVIPLAPHLYLPAFISEETERELAVSIDLKFLEMCRELWAFGDRISSGMKKEIEYAGELGIPVRYIREEINVRDK